MTLKQTLTLQDLPKSNYVLSKSMRKSGYTEHSINSGAVRKTILDKLDKKKYFDEDMRRREYKRALRDVKKEKDNTNRIRTLEGMARLEALFTDKIENKGDVAKVVIAYGTSKPAPVDTLVEGK